MPGGEGMVAYEDVFADAPALPEKLEHTPSNCLGIEGIPATVNPERGRLYPTRDLAPFLVQLGTFFKFVRRPDVGHRDPSADEI